MIINSHNDWDPLEEVVVGHAHHSRVATDISARSFSYADLSPDQLPAEGVYPQWVIDEANEDADALADTLSNMGVTVHRPKIIDWENIEYNIGQGWSSKGWYSWCPRDCVLPLGNMLIETASPVRSRYFETKLYEDILYSAFEDGALWIQTPKPNLHDDLYQLEDLSKPTLLNNEIIFDSPNIVRVGTDLLYQVSNSGNHKGLKWLRRLLEPMGYKLHPAEHIYSYGHFDSTIIPLRPGLVLLNSKRVTPENCPSMFAKWDKIWFDDCVVQGSKLEGYPPPCSPYIGMNILSLDQNTIVCDSAQEPLMRELDKWGINSVPVRFRHAMTLSGGIHCATLDLRRKGTLESYCD